MKQYLFGVVLAVTLTASPALAHPGNVAADGCHFCRTNCEKWGEVEGARHCHKERQPSRARQSGNITAYEPQAATRRREPPFKIQGSVPRIIDADTLEVAAETVRLQGIDAPETAQACRQATGKRYLCGEHATQALRGRVGAGTVSCTIEERDRYGRGLGVCYTVDGMDLNGWLVRQGHALAYRQYSTKYVPEEERAKAGRAGIWAGEFVPPWNWRRGVRLR